MNKARRKVDAGLLLCVKRPRSIVRGVQAVLRTLKGKGLMLEKYLQMFANLRTDNGRGILDGKTQIARRAQGEERKNVHTLYAKENWKC